MSAPTHNPGSSFYLALMHFLMDAKQHVVALGAEHGLSSIQAITLLVLEERHNCPMKHLGQMFHCDASNVTGIIDGLESKGLVTRENDPHDRRIKTIRICPAGRKLQEHILDGLIRDSGFLFDPLTQAEADELVRIIHKLSFSEKPA